jgi:hypothetical protein
MIDEQLQELERAAVPMLADSKTLLKYGIVCTPNPLQAGHAGSQLAVVITNASSGGLVTVKSIQVVLSVGTAAKNLIASKDFGTVDPPGWQAVPDGGTITLTPLTDDFAKVGERAVVLQITGLAINSEPGYTNVNIVENASTEQQPESMRLGAIELMKAPAQFQLSELKVDPVDIEYDGATQVSWSGSPASYTLQYSTASGVKKIEGLPNAGSHRAEHLVQFPALFTLTVSVAIPGDKPVVVQRQAFAQLLPELSIDDFSASASGFGVNEPVTLRWRRSARFASTAAHRRESISPTPAHASPPPSTCTQWQSKAAEGVSVRSRLPRASRRSRSSSPQPMAAASRRNHLSSRCCLRSSRRRNQSLEGSALRCRCCRTGYTRSSPGRRIARPA